MPDTTKYTESQSAHSVIVYHGEEILVCNGHCCSLEGIRLGAILADKRGVIHD